MNYTKNKGMSLIELIVAAFMLTLIATGSYNFLINKKTQKIYDTEQQKMDTNFENIYNEITQNINDDFVINNNNELIIQNPDKPCSQNENNTYKVVNNQFYCNNEVLANNVESINFKVGYDNNNDNVIDEYQSYTQNQPNNQNTDKRNLMIEVFTISGELFSISESIVLNETSYNFLNISNEEIQKTTDKLIKQHRRIFFLHGRGINK